MARLAEAYPRYDPLMLRRFCQAYERKQALTHRLDEELELNETDNPMLISCNDLEALARPMGDETCNANRHKYAGWLRPTEDILLRGSSVEKYALLHPFAIMAAHVVEKGDGNGRQIRIYTRQESAQRAAELHQHPALAWHRELVTGPDHGTLEANLLNYAFGYAPMRVVSQVIPIAERQSSQNGRIYLAQHIVGETAASRKRVAENVTSDILVFHEKAREPPTVISYDNYLECDYASGVDR